MTIDGVNISTYKLKFLKISDNHNLAARKKVLNQATHAVDDIVFQAQQFTVELLGRFTNSADLLSNLNAFETKLKTPLKHALVITEHGISADVVFADGYEVVPYNNGKIAKIIVRITVAE